MSDSSSVLKIIEFWTAMPLREPPIVLPEDLPAMQWHAAELLALPAANFRQFLTSQRFGDFSDHRFRFSLLPIPWMAGTRTDLRTHRSQLGFHVTVPHVYPTNRILVPGGYVPRLRPSLAFTISNRPLSSHGFNVRVFTCEGR